MYLRNKNFILLKHLITHYIFLKFTLNINFCFHFNWFLDPSKTRNPCFKLRNSWWHCLQNLNHFTQNPLRRGLLSQPVIQVCVALPPGCVQAAGGGNCMPVVLWGTLPCRRGLSWLCWKRTDWKDPIENVFFLHRPSWYRNPTLNKLERGVDGLAAVPLLLAMAPPAWETSSAGWCHTRLAQQNPRPLLWNRSISRVNWLNHTTPC